MFFDNFVLSILAICDLTTCQPDQECVVLNSPDPITGLMFKCQGGPDETFPQCNYITT